MERMFFSELDVLFQARAASLMKVAVPIFELQGSMTSMFVVDLVALPSINISFLSNLSG